MMYIDTSLVICDIHREQSVIDFWESNDKKARALLWEIIEWYLKTMEFKANIIVGVQCPGLGKYYDGEHLPPCEFLITGIYEKPENRHEITSRLAQFLNMALPAITNNDTTGVHEDFLPICTRSIASIHGNDDSGMQGGMRIVSPLEPYTEDRRIATSTKAISHE